MTENIEPLGQNDVVKLKEEKAAGAVSHTTFTVNDFTSELVSNSSYPQFDNWSKDGIEAEVLVAGKSWRKGKVRLTMEFIPDESSIESPLDEFRNKPNN